MKLGIFSKQFERPTLGEALDAVVAHGITQIQLNLSSALLPNMPSALTVNQCDSIRHELDRRGIVNAVLSGTFNIIHLDDDVRQKGFDSFAVLAANAKSLGTETLSLSTGTRDQENMWRKHPENGSADAWRDMLGSMSRLAAIAEKHRVTIAFEPEQANIVDSAQKARALMDAVKSPRVKVLIDAANLLNRSNLHEQDRVLKEAFDLVGEDIVVAHAKEFSADGRLGGVALGRGAVNFRLYLSLLKAAGEQIPVIMHGFDESAVAESLAHLTGILKN